MQHYTMDPGTSGSSSSGPWSSSSAPFSEGTSTTASSYPSTSIESVRRSQDYGQGWTQLTDHGKIYMSKKEKNVFILEGTNPDGLSVCRYGGSPAQQAIIESGSFTLTSELKCSTDGSIPDLHIYLLVDITSVSDYSHGCDFCGLSLRFDSGELRVENHRKNRTVQTLFVQPGCSALQTNTYVLITISLDGEHLSLNIAGAPIINNLLIGRPNRAAVGANGLSLGLGVYGRSRCYLSRFRISQYESLKATEDSGKQPQPSQATMTKSAGPLANGAGTSMGVAVGQSLAASDAKDMAAMIERDLLCKDMNVRFEDISGLEDAKRAVNEAVLLPLIMPEFFTGLRKPWKGVLLFGPPGCGKTMMAKAVASCTEHLTFFNCSSATLASKWHGESENLLKLLFQAARARVPAVLFFDEFDSMLSQRGGTNEHEASRRFKTEFLIQMDGLLSDTNTESGHLLVLATSNAPWDLDEGVRRRFDKCIYLPLPDQDARAKMFESSMKGIAIGDDVEPTTLATMTEGYSGSDMQSLLKEASMNPIRRMITGMSPTDLMRLRDEGKLSPDGLPVTLADFETARASVQQSVAPGDTERYEQWARRFGSR
mmetsp:Transcript_57558/g.148052  ORF Transcript_57558/g.148052 Transcript_57558/m.148052 type:complete len:598 (-) Transcript_57558:113-1906(-)